MVSIVNFLFQLANSWNCVVVMVVVVAVLVVVVVLVWLALRGCVFSKFQSVQERFGQKVEVIEGIIADTGVPSEGVGVGTLHILVASGVGKLHCTVLAGAEFFYSGGFDCQIICHQIHPRLEFLHIKTVLASSVFLCFIKDFGLD